MVLIALGIVAVALALRIERAQAATDCHNYLEQYAADSPEGLALAALCQQAAVSSTSSSHPEVAAPTVPRVSPGLRELERSLEELVEAANDGRYAIAVTDLQTLETISVAGDRLQLAGCAINFFALLQATVDAHRARYREERVGEVIQRTVYSSSAVDGHALYGILGDGDVLAGLRRTTQLIASMWLTNTILDHAPAFYESGSLRGTDNYLTALDANQALTELWLGRVVPIDWRDYLLDKMANVKPGLNYLVGYGHGGVASHKNGFLPAPAGWVDNDLGIVRFERGGTTYAYAITLLSEHVSEKYGDLPTLQAAARVTWEYFDRTYAR